MWYADNYEKIIVSKNIDEKGTQYIGNAAVKKDPVVTLNSWNL
jgi:hypothetical protein